MNSLTNNEWSQVHDPWEIDVIDMACLLVGWTRKETLTLLGSFLILGCRHVERNKYTGEVGVEGRAGRVGEV